MKAPGDKTSIPEPSVLHLDRADLEGLLRWFEESHAKETGEYLTSAELYERYRAGEIDTPDAMAWATYYEASLAAGPAANAAIRAAEAFAAA